MRKIFLLFTIVILSLASTSWANELHSKSKAYPIIVKLSDKRPYGIDYAPVIEVCSRTDSGMQCESYPKVEELVLQETGFDWDFFLRRCNSFVFRNRLILGAKIKRSIMILAAGVATSAVTIPTTLTVGSALSTAGLATGLSGTGVVATTNMANIMLTPSKAYPDYRIETFPSDQREDGPDVKSGMARATQLINFIVADGDGKKTIPDRDILALQDIALMAFCRQKQSTIINNSAWAAAMV